VRVVTENGSIELGTIESSPTIGITDYSRRTTDEFGVTTVVKRSFARQMSVRLAVPSAGVDALQRQLADLRATSATWIGDDPYGNLTVRGFYKNFEVDHPTSLISYCTLTIEGLTGEAEFTDDGTDPAPGGKPSTLQVLQPIAITDAVLMSSSVAEDDAIEWSSAGGYPAGTRVIRRGTHRVYESIIASNIGNDPAVTVGAWIDVGPTNRWAMFDQAIGSTTTDDNVITVALRPGLAVSGLAILDTNAARVRVQAPGYDRTVAVTGGATSALFLDLVTTAGASLTVTLTAVGNTAQRVLLDDAAPFDDAGTFRDTVAGTASAEPPTWDDSGTVRDTTAWQDTRAGDGTVSVGTLMVGTLRPLGRTGSSPTSSITDYSKRETDDFGEIAIVPRAWAKRMAAKALIRTDAVDQVIGRVAAVRAVPSLWLADRATESLTVYGFFKDFSVEVGQSVSTLSLSIEGFSEAATPAPLTIPWENVSGTKPTENADNTSENTSKDTSAVAGVPATQVIADAASVKQRSDILENITIPAINSAVAAANALIKTAGAKADAALADLNAKLLSSGIALDGSLASADSKLGAARVAAELAVSRANTRIDAAMTDLNAEANRAQGKDELLERRIDSLTVVTNKNDGEVRALIETERLVRTDDVRAIAQRIDSVVTDYTSRDSVTNTRITTQVTALSAADRALGERIDTVTTEFKAADSATSTRITDSVAALSAADEAIGRRVDSIVTDVTTKDTATRAEISRVELASSTRDTALGQRIDSVETDYKSRDSATNTRITTQVTALSAADVALGERIDTVTTDFKAADAATSTRITQSVTALSNADAALGQRIDTITTDYKAADSATSTRITTAVATLSDADTAVGQRVDTITTDYISRDSRTNARVDQTVSAMSEADRALGSRIDTVAASFGTALTAKAQEITTAFTSADTALANRTEVLEASSRATDTAIPALTARIKSTEDTLVDLPNRYAASSFVQMLDAQMRGAEPSGISTSLIARIEDRATAIADAMTGAVAQTVSQLRAEYNNTAASVNTTAAAIVDLRGRTAAYWRTTAVAGNNRAQITISADANAGAGVDIVGDVSISGNLLVAGSIITEKIAPNAASSIGAAILAGGLTDQDNPLQTDLFSVSSTGAPLAVDVQFDAYRSTAGTGILQAVLFQRAANGDTALKQVRLRNPSTNTGGPTNFWVLTTAPPGPVGFYLSFDVASGGGQTYGGFNVSSVGLRVTEFKR